MMIENLFIIIQARMTSTRLPNKVMLPLAGSVVLDVMLKRLGDLKDNVIIATTDDDSALPIVEYCQRENVRFYRGDTDNVLSRYYGAAKSFGATANSIIVRCTSDCPLIDKQTTHETINFFKRQGVGFVAAGPHSGFPNGFDTEVFRFSALEQAHINATSAVDREHLTQYIIRHNSRADYVAKQDHGHLRLTLDEPDDYEAIKAIYALFDNTIAFSYAELLAKLSQHPEIIELNRHVEQVQV